MGLFTVQTSVISRLMEKVGRLCFAFWKAVNLLLLFIEVELYSAQQSQQSNNNGSKNTASP
jgi:hypothetical protein